MRSERANWIAQGLVAPAFGGLVGCTGSSATAPMARPSAQTIYVVPSAPADTTSHNYNYNYNDTHSTSTSVSHVYIQQDINAHPGSGPVPPDNGTASADQGIEQRQPDTIDQGNHPPSEDDQATQQPAAEPEPPAPEQQPREEPAAPESEPQVAEPPAQELPPPSEEPPAEPSSPPSDSGQRRTID